MCSKPDVSLTTRYPGEPFILKVFSREAHRDDTVRPVITDDVSIRRTGDGLRCRDEMTIHTNRNDTGESTPFCCIIYVIVTASTGRPRRRETHGSLAEHFAHHGAVPDFLRTNDGCPFMRTGGTLYSLFRTARVRECLVAKPTTASDTTAGSLTDASP